MQIHKGDRNFNTLVISRKYYPFTIRVLDNLNILNTIMIFLIFILGTYIIIKPIFPEISFVINQNFKNIQEKNILYSNINTSNISNQNNFINPVIKESPLDKSIKKIHISTINLNSNLYSNNNSNSLYKGVWHKANSGNPIKGGNMVITAHRFMYTSNNDSFYHLPKLKINDTIIIDWEGKEYEYLISETRIVTPDQIEIEYKTKEHILTLYTCTPLWTSTQRFVVIARPK